ncbi:MAG: Ldh family oxidoreductase [Kosmotogaceae bacterium]|nr:Ldh family oxidoreductase [Kosmotogaceae bacterium]
MGRLVAYENLRKLCEEILLSENFNTEVAHEIVDVLLEADLRAIPSHGVARLGRYIKERDSGNILLDSKPTIVHDTPVSATVDGKGGPGQCVSNYAMDLAITKAKKSMIGLVSVRNSNHYGISAYYSEKALSEKMMGIAMTNSYPLVVPTFGKEAVLGTNPFSVAIPGLKKDFILDMATSVVTRGKLEVYDRLERDIPNGWAVDETGTNTTSPRRVLNNFNNRNPGGILPLGGSEEDFGGHKGYGMALLVDLLSAGLSMGKWSAETYSGSQAGVSHFFGCFSLELFGDRSSLIEHLEHIVDGVISSKKADGHHKIYYHGEKEAMARERAVTSGIDLDQKTRDSLASLAKKHALSIPVELLD